MGLWEEDNRGKVLFLSCHIKGSHYQHDITLNVDLNPLAELVVVKFLHYKFTLFYFFPSTLYSLERSPMPTHT